MLIKVISSFTKRSIVQKLHVAALSSKAKFVPENFEVSTYSKWNDEYFDNPKNEVAQLACTRFDPIRVTINNRDNNLLVYNHNFPVKGNPVSNQDRRTGRCWMFSALNVARLLFMKKNNIDNFEFSHNYLLIWDKIERSYKFLEKVIDFAKKKKPIDDEDVQLILDTPYAEGANWELYVDMVAKYGIIPDKCWPETSHSINTIPVNLLLLEKLREFAVVLRKEVESGASNDALIKLTRLQINQIYNFVVTYFGTPPKTFKFDYYCKAGKYHTTGVTTPLQFYEKELRPLFDPSTKVRIYNYPQFDYEKLYTIRFFDSVVGGSRVLINNQPVDVLIKAVVDSLDQEQPVWFTCDHSKRNYIKKGLFDLDAFNYKLPFNIDGDGLGIPKGERLKYFITFTSHAVAFVGYEEENGKPIKFDVENSYGTKEGIDGHQVLTEAWFKEFVFSVVVDRKFLSKKVLDVLKLKPIVIPYQPVEARGGCC